MRTRVVEGQVELSQTSVKREREWGPEGGEKEERVRGKLHSNTQSPSAFRYICQLSLNG